MKLIKILSLLLIVLTLVACEDGNNLDPLLNGAPPVYQGMQVSNSNLAISNERAFFLSQSFKTNLGINDNIPTVDIPEQENLIFYANHNQWFEIWADQLGGNLPPKGPEFHSDKGGIQLPHYHPFGKKHAHALFIIYNK